MSRPLRVLIVDDSALFVEALALVLEEDPELQVVGSASNGLEAVALVEALGPDVVTMDIAMPRMDGLEAVERIMASRPTPILLLTGDPTRTGEQWHFEALRRGALDLMPKPPLMAGEARAAAEGEALRAHLKLLASIPVVYRRLGRERARPEHRGAVAGPAALRAPLGSAAVGIVASTGGPPVLAEILEALPADFPLPILVVQHLAAGFAPHLVEWLDATCDLRVSLAHRGQRPQPGEVLIAPEDRHLVLRLGGTVDLRGSAPHDGHRPSGTVLLESLAEACGANGVGVVLTGMGRDGARGIAALRGRGGQTLAQEEATSAVYGMPRAAAEAGAEIVLPRQRLADGIVAAAARVVGWS